MTRPAFALFSFFVCVSALVPAVAALTPRGESHLGAVSTNGTGPLCPVCQSLLTVVQDAVEANATSETIVKVLDDVCQLFGPSVASLCADIVLALDDELFGALPEVNWPAVVCGVANYCAYPCCLTDAEPEQIHLGLAAAPETQMVVMWTTFANTSSLVRFGASPNALTETAEGLTLTYTAAGWQGTLHRVLVDDLSPGTKYFYSVGDGQNMSAVFHFKTAPAPNAARGINMLLVGDMGVLHSNETMLAMASDVASGEFDFVHHLGDVSYAEGFQPVWDEFMRRIEPIAAYVPYVVSVGNHDCPFEFASIRARFYNPFDGLSEPSNLYWSVQYRYVHLLVFATDATPGDSTTQFAPGTPQFDWIVADLSAYNTTVAPALHSAGLPSLLFLSGHRPLYCTSAKDDWVDCQIHAPIFRGWVEDLFYDFGADVVLQAHEHAYERCLPVYRQVPEPSYELPRAPVYIVNGAGGNIENLDPLFENPSPPWSVFRNGTIFGYGRMFLAPPSSVAQVAAHWEFVAADTLAVVDEVDIVFRA
eukprot:Amastigsp_a676288_29.p1 type:complete len:534 gc:universal Amastigsp_a676288_29:310-1911(+)